MAAEGGPVADITPDFDERAALIGWRPGGVCFSAEQVAFIEADSSHYREVYVSPLKTFAPRKLTDFAWQLKNPSLATREVMKRLAIVLALNLVTNTAPAADLLAVYQRSLQNDPQLREAEVTRLAALEAKTSGAVVFTAAVVRQRPDLA